MNLNITVRIHGIAGGKVLTLVHCLRTNESMQAPGIVREKYRASVILSGCQLNDSARHPHWSKYSMRFA